MKVQITSGPRNMDDLILEVLPALQRSARILATIYHTHLLDWEDLTQVAALVVVSLDEPVAAGSDETLLDLLADESCGQDEYDADYDLYLDSLPV